MLICPLDCPQAVWGWKRICLNGIVAHQSLRCADFRLTFALRLALHGTRFKSSSSQSSAHKRLRDNFRQRSPVSRKIQYGEPSLPPEVDLRISRFRKITETISQELPAPSPDLHTWVEDFLELGSLRLLRDGDCSEVARTLHNIDRKSGKNQKSRQSIYTLVEKVRQIYASGSLPSEREAFLHLLSYYKESGHLNEGLAFWKWLSAKEAKLDPVCAGAAIELLAVYGAGIRYCEDVYERTLLQQEGIGSQYHMSPGNILPDRSKAITVRGTSSALLQGILSARLFYGKWRRSYLTLDTAFMLRPTQIVPRFLNLFVYERPIFEALPLFLMYCRGGNTVSMATLAAILKSLQSLVHHAGQYPVRVQVVQAMLRVLETYTGSGGRLKTHHLDILASALLNAMPPVSVPATPVQPIEGDEDTATTVQNSLAKLFKYFTRHNAPPNYVTFSEIISNSVRLGYPDLAKTAFQSMRFLDISPSVVHAAEVIRAAAEIRDPDLLQSAWTCLRTASESDATGVPAPRRWRDLAIAARVCGLESFVQEELQSLPPEHSHQANSAVQLEEEKKAGLEESCPAQVEQKGHENQYRQAFANLCAEICSTLDCMERCPIAGYRDFQRQPIDEPGIFKWPEIAEESWQRKLYDELTLENSSNDSRPTLEDNLDGLQGATPDISNTGIPFDELRYLNWKTVNNLLVQTEAWERRVEASTDAAIKGVMPSLRAQGSTSGATAIRYPVTVQQLDDYHQDVENERATSMTEEEWRKRILRLRNPDFEA